MADRVNPYTNLINQAQARSVIGQAAPVFRAIGPGGVQFADLIESNPNAAAEIAYQFGGFESMHKALVSQAMAGAQQRNAGMGINYENVLRALPDTITSPAEMARAQNILAMGQVPTSQWSAILGERVIDPEAIQVGRDKLYFDQYQRQIEGMGGPIQAQTVINMPPRPMDISDYGKLRGYYNEDQADYIALSRGLSKARALAMLDSPESHIDLITLIAKAMDPNSVVREGEITMRITNASVQRQFKRWVKQAFNNKGFLVDQDIQDIIDSMEVQLQAEEARARQVETAYQRIMPDPVASGIVMPLSVDDMRERAMEEAWNSPNRLSAEERDWMANPKAIDYDKAGNWQETAAGTRYRVMGE